MQVAELLILWRPRWPPDRGCFLEWVMCQLDVICLRYLLFLGVLNFVESPSQESCQKGCFLLSYVCHMSCWSSLRAKSSWVVSGLSAYASFDAQCCLANRGLVWIDFLKSIHIKRNIWWLTFNKGRKFGTLKKLHSVWALRGLRHLRAL